MPCPCYFFEHCSVFLRARNITLHYTMPNAHANANAMTLRTFCKCCSALLCSATPTGLFLKAAPECQKFSLSNASKITHIKKKKIPKGSHRRRPYVFSIRARRRSTCISIYLSISTYPAYPTMALNGNSAPGSPRPRSKRAEQSRAEQSRGLEG